ncbi:DUF6970 domain-containing protein [Flavisolibacter nicotianae]|uniref:DUF6970 domain-containing protein n=1 Tax=Flavisolibacter nicotianae TaxID=2364882 RepID=UPI001F09587E|nr:hypothetical protein [Flavisolibacter nicotianae]
MKHYLLTAAIVVNMTQQKCDKAVVVTPSCIQARIEEIKKQPRWNPPAQVEEYVYNGKRAFLFSSNCCDQYNELVDENCNYLCAPSGGFTGRGDRKCPNFKDSAQFIRLVWKDERK